MRKMNLQEAIADKCCKALANTAPLLVGKITQFSPTEAMFVLAVDGVTNSPMSGLSEESLTANFAGRLAAQYTWAVECMGNKGDKSALWGEYSKNGQGYDSESKRGADFALVVPVSEQEVKVAIFQAKKARGEQANISQGGSKTAPESQLDKFIETVRTIASAAGIPAEDSLSWGHYVFWRDTREYPKSISLTQLDRILKDQDEEYDLGKVDIDDQVFGSFANLLLSVKVMGHVEKGIFGVVEGWLRLGVGEARDFLPKLHMLTDVIFADEEGQGGHFANFLNVDAKKSLSAKIDSVDQKSVAEQKAGMVIATRPKRKM